jgi:hypothetical protein
MRSMEITGDLPNKFEDFIIKFTSMKIESMDGPIEARIYSLYLGRLLTIKIFRFIVDYFDGPYVNILEKHTSRFLVIATK